MSQRIVRRVVLLVVLALSLSLPGSAAPRSWAPAGPSGVSVSGLWSWLVAAWWKERCSISPWGSCLDGGGSPLPAKEGCGSDPNGHCLNGGGGVTTQAGCISDPNGHCLGGTGSPATAEAGCGSDPNGHCH